MNDNHQGKPPRRGGIPAGGGIHLPEGGDFPGQSGAGEEEGPPARKPNILVIFGDDIGHHNISAYNLGLMGYRTPNIDRIAREGVLFTDAYGDQSCTAGRSSFLLGQTPIRTGLTKVGVPGDLFGISMRDPTLANLLQEEGYACGQFGKNHLGDHDWHLPTVHGFDVFFGNLYHLNSHEEPENPDFPDAPRFPRPRGVLRCTRTSPTSQEIEDTGPLSTGRMPGIDDEFADAAEAWIRGQHAAGKPWFCWFNTSRMHIFTRLKPESDGVTGLGVYPDGMTEHDGHVGRLLGLLDELDIAGDTIVLYSTDNGAEVMSWPDGGCTPFRSEKNSTWEGAYRVPMLARWPGVLPAGAQCNGITSMLDWLPTLMSAVGRPGIKADLMRGISADGRSWRAFLDGYDLLPALRGRAAWPRSEFFYITDDAQVCAVRHNQHKIVYLESTGAGFGVWQLPFRHLRLPKIVNLRSDPFERADEEPAMGNTRYTIDRLFLFTGAAALVKALSATLAEWPPHLTDPGDLGELARAHEVSLKDSPVVKTYRGGSGQLDQLAAWLHNAASAD